MSQPDNSILASAINLSGPVATVLLPASDLAAILQEVRSLRTEFEQFREQVADDQAADRRRIKALETTEPQPLQKDRGEILRALLMANGGKMLAKDARQRMRVSKTIFSRLLANMRDDIEIRPFHADRKRHLLVLRAAKG
jgi:hypothetical protein